MHADTPVSGSFDKIPDFLVCSEIFIVAFVIMDHFLRVAQKFFSRSFCRVTQCHHIIGYHILWNAQQIIDSIDPTFALYRHSGLSTGEGILQVLKDSSESGVPRPAVFAESEFASVMRRKERKGNTLDQYIRQAWDDVPLSVSTKNDPLRIEGSHISLVVHK